MFALRVRLDALLALRARALLLVQDPVPLRDAALGLLAAIFTRAATHTCGETITAGDCNHSRRLQSQQATAITAGDCNHSRRRGRARGARAFVPTVPLLQESASSPMARGSAVGRPVMSTRKYFFAWGSRA
jgi:endonuclease/exonuclease/phosphatase (EEP) superfamily protein YafD